MLAAPYYLPGLRFVLRLGRFVTSAGLFGTPPAVEAGGMGILPGEVPIGKTRGET